jgi:hypothetical protein
MPSQNPLVIAGATEGIVDEAVLTRLVHDAGGKIGSVYGKNGKPHLRRTIGGYNRAAQFSPWLVLVDLDNDADCAPALAAAWLPEPAAMMGFRVAVRAIEAWILADTKNFAEFLRVPAGRLPRDPDGVVNPKRLVVDLAQGSRRSDVRQDMVPRPGSGRSVGPAYASRLIEFAATAWDPDIAAVRSDSLRRCREGISDLIRRQRV